jgi:hypothetical protein
VRSELQLASGMLEGRAPEPGRGCHRSPAAPVAEASAAESAGASSGSSSEVSTGGGADSGAGGGYRGWWRRRNRLRFEPPLT